MRSLLPWKGVETAFIPEGYRIGTLSRLWFSGKAVYPGGSIVILEAPVLVLKAIHA